MSNFVLLQILAFVIFFISFVTALIVSKLYVVLLGSLVAVVLLLWAAVERKKKIEK